MIEALPRQYILSADLGQAHDSTALTVTEKAEVATDEPVVIQETGLDRTKFEPPGGTRVVKHSREALNIRHLQRLALHTTYPEQIRIIAALFKALPAAQLPPQLVVDKTGVGAPVVQAMREAGLDPIGVVITAGHEAVKVSRTEFRVPKRVLVSNLSVALASGRLQISPDLSEGDALINELVNFKMKISASGHDSYEAWRESIHDDLVLSVAIGLYIATRQPKPSLVIPHAMSMRPL